MKRKPGTLLINLVTFVFIHIMVVSSALGIACLVIWQLMLDFNFKPNPFIGCMILLSSCVLATTCATAINGNRMLKPIYHIKRGMLSIAQGKFETRLQPEGCTKEVVEMTEAFNKMASELESVEMLREDFVANVSHEFKTPLTSIEGYALLLQDPNLSEEERLEYTQIIIENTKKLTSMTSNILKLSKLERQDIILKKQNFRLDEQIRQVILSLIDSWQEKEIEFDIELETVSYLGDEELLGHVWKNLIENAIKFSDVGSCIEVGLKKEKHALCVRIQDHGIGMSEETQKHMFEKFYQGDSSRSTKGNGLGLAICKQVVELSGGMIEVSSQLQEGTYFKVTLPEAI